MQTRQLEDSVLVRSEIKHCSEGEGWFMPIIIRWRGVYMDTVHLWDYLHCTCVVTRFASVDRFSASGKHSETEARRSIWIDNGCSYCRKELHEQKLRLTLIKRKGHKSRTNQEHADSICLQEWQQCIYIRGRKKFQTFFRHWWLTTKFCGNLTTLLHQQKGEQKSQWVWPLLVAPSSDASSRVPQLLTRQFAM